MAYTSIENGVSVAPEIGIAKFAAALRGALTRRRRSPAKVNGLSERMLRDIGITPADIEGLESYAQYRDRLTNFY